MTRRTLRFVLCAAALAAGTLVIHADDKITAGNAELQFQLGNLLTEETRFREALDAYNRALQTDDPDLQVRARAGKVKTALRIAEFDLAQKEGELLRASAPSDPEALSLYADSLWSGGLFDEADDVYRQALSINKESSRARFGVARSLATRSKLGEALIEAQAAAAMAPRDGEIYAEIGEIYQRMHRFDEAANAYNNFINLLPNKDRSDKAAWTRSQVKFLKAFEGRNPVEIDPEDLEKSHTIPFRLVDDKIVVQARVNGGRQQDFILDTGSEETVISRDTAQRANISAITYTLSAGVGEVGLRGLQLSRIDRLDIGDMQVRNLPVLIKNPALRGLPKREGESFSPLSFGMSMLIDYQHRTTHDWQKSSGARGRFAAPADARPSSRDGARHAERHTADVFRRRHRRGSDLDQCRDRRALQSDVVPQDSVEGVRHIRVGSRRIPAPWNEPELRSDRIQEHAARGAESARAERAPRLRAWRHRRPQLPQSLSSGARHGPERVATTEVLAPLVCSPLLCDSARVHSNPDVVFAQLGRKISVVNATVMMYRPSAPLDTDSGC
jgi:tetratricopeptide (TPR) repeat protein